MSQTCDDLDLLARCDPAAYRVHKCRGGCFTALRYDPTDADEVVIGGAPTGEAAKAIIMREIMRSRAWFASRMGRRWTPDDAMPTEWTSRSP